MPNGQSKPIRIQLVAPSLGLWGLERLVESDQPRLALVGSAASVAKCVPMLSSNAPDVVVLDLDGEEGTASMEALHRQSKAKILVVTGSSSLTLYDSVVLLGARGVVHKMETPATLLKAIERVSAGELWIDRKATTRLFLQMAHLKAVHADNPLQKNIASLTRRERQTVAALTSDSTASGKIVAERLHISEHTLRNHLTSIYSKLGLSNRVDLYAFAHKHGLASQAA